MRETKLSIRRSFVSVGDISANSLSRSAGVARMSAISVLQNTTDSGADHRDLVSSYHASPGLRRPQPVLLTLAEARDFP